MYSLSDIESRSASKEKLIVDYTDAMELLHIYESTNDRILGWEGWIKHASGNLELSHRYQESTDFASMPNSSALALSTSKIMQAYTEWEENPEAENATLLFCIKTRT